jgi:signal transduction histidine kinase
VPGLGTNLGMADELMDTDPEQARELLREARSITSAALSEPRDLVRGIHPPVRAERGLDGAIRALALAVPIRVDVSVELGESRLSQPLEAAAYFAVAEALTNQPGQAQRSLGRLDTGAAGRRPADDRGR